MPSSIHCIEGGHGFALGSDEASKLLSKSCIYIYIERLFFEACTCVLRLQPCAQRPTTFGFAACCCLFMQEGKKGAPRCFASWQDVLPVGAKDQSCRRLAFPFRGPARGRTHGCAASVTKAYTYPFDKGWGGEVVVRSRRTTSYVDQHIGCLVMRIAVRHDGEDRLF